MTTHNTDREKLEACPWCPTTRRETYNTEGGVVGVIIHHEGCFLAACERRQILTPKGVIAWNSRAAVAAPRAAVACGVCKFHWDMIVMPGDTHNPNCPYSETASSPASPSLIDWLRHAKSEIECHAEWWGQMYQPHFQARAKQALAMVADINKVLESCTAATASSPSLISEQDYSQEVVVGRRWLEHKDAAERVVARIADNDCLTCKHWTADAVYAIAVELATTAATPVTATSVELPPDTDDTTYSFAICPMCKQRAVKADHWKESGVTYGPMAATSGAREAAKEVATWVMNLEHPLTSETDLYTTQGIVESIISKHFAVPVEEQSICDCHAWPTVTEMHAYCVALETIVRGTQFEHKCKPIARAIMDEGRDWWIGELLEPVPEWPKETHCLHMTTPVKDVVFLCNAGDFEQLMVLSNVIVGLKSLSWLESMTEGAKLRSTSLSGEAK